MFRRSKEKALIRLRLTPKKLMAVRRNVGLVLPLKDLEGMRLNVFECLNRV